MHRLPSVFIEIVVILIDMVRKSVFLRLWGILLD